jgi:hypothetical protein
MFEPILRCILQGDEFSEIDIQKNTGIIFHSVIRRTQKKIPIKRYNQVVTILPAENNIHGDDYIQLIMNFSEFLINKVEIIKNCGCEAIVLSLDIKYEDQCNLCLDKTVSKMISECFDSFWITCYKEGDI